LLELALKSWATRLRGAGLSCFTLFGHRVPFVDEIEEGITAAGRRARRTAIRVMFLAKPS